MNLARVPVARALVALLLPMAVIVAACSSDLAPTPTPGPLATGPVTETLQPPTSFGPPPSPTPPDDATPIVLDPTLLAYFPTSIGDTSVDEDPNEASTALTDPALPRIATAVDAAVAFDGGANLVYSWIVRLRPGVFNDGDYRQWRDSYDEGACAAAGGIVGHAEATIAERQAFVTSCAAGLHTYHVWLKGDDILISASSIGDARFGELLLEGLRVPA